MNKCRGEEKTLNTMVEKLKLLGYCGGKIRIAHCFNETTARKLKYSILTEWKNAKIEFYRCRGLCSFYAEKGGLLLGFEKE